MTLRVPLTLARHAMATRFEIVLPGENEMTLRAAGEEALNEVERLEALLSLYRPGSEISHLNSRAGKEPVRVSPETFSLLTRAKQLSEETDGAFDITVAPLMRCWGFMGGNRKVPASQELAEARAKVGMKLVHLNARDFTVRFERAGVMLDLGAIGKGYAVEKAVEILRAAGVTSALIHGGTSTVHAIGRPPNEEFWKVAIERPKGFDDRTPGLFSIPLCDEALSVSAVWGKFFQTDGKQFGHLLDPRTGQPVSDTVLAAVVLSSATESDALSTALLILGSGGHGKIFQLRSGIKTLLIAKTDAGLHSEARGILPETRA
jgi:thiamine biosynthesis lipoprotein